MMKTWFKTAIRRSGGWLLPRARAKHILNNRSRFAVILMYHRVLPDELVSAWPFKSLVIGETAFRRQVEWLGLYFKVLRISDLVYEIRSEVGARAEEQCRPLVAITFDDGYWDNALTAAPILEAHGLRGTFYVTSGFIDTERRLWFDAAARLWMKRNDRSGRSVTLSQWMGTIKAMSPLDRAAFLQERTTQGDWYAGKSDRAVTSQELSMLAEAGHEIGCHTRTHPILTQLSRAELKDEINGSMEDLKCLGCKVLSIAYPNGNLN
jgi:peptidoglycan/xylan/chitin deacetylase (PgdA/CDA1 family)